MSLAIAQEVDREFPWLLQYNNSAADTEYLQRLILRLGEPWGLLSKSDGERGHTLPSPGRCVSHDVVVLPDGRRWDVISGSDAHPNPAAPSWNEIPRHLWRESNVYVAARHWPIFDSGVPHETTETRALLGRGYFGMIRHVLDREPEVETNMNWILTHENPDIFRVFLSVMGTMHGNPPPWRDAGIIWSNSRWAEGFRRVLDIMKVANKKVLCTIAGDLDGIRNSSDVRAFNDKIVSVIEDDWEQIYGFEIANEYNINGFDENMVRAWAVDLKPRLPSGTLLALSSPALAHGSSDATREEMGESIESLYGDDHDTLANFMSVHLVRDLDSLWAEPASYNEFRRTLPKANNEPFGQYSSVWWTSDVGQIVRNYEKTSKAKWLYYMAHNAWSAFGGYLPSVYIDQMRRTHGDAYADAHLVKFISEMENQLAVSTALKEYRESGKIIGGGSGGGTGGHMAKHPYPDENTFWVEFARKAADLYRQAGRLDVATILEADPRIFIWWTRTAWDLADSLTPEKSAEKHLEELKGTLGL